MFRMKLIEAHIKKFGHTPAVLANVYMWCYRCEQEVS